MNLPLFDCPYTSIMGKDLTINGEEICGEDYNYGAGRHNDHIPSGDHTKRELLELIGELAVQGTTNPDEDIPKAIGCLAKIISLHIPKVPLPDTISYEDIKSLAEEHKLDSEKMYTLTQSNFECHNDWEDDNYRPDKEHDVMEEVVSEYLDGLTEVNIVYE